MSATIILVFGIVGIFAAIMLSLTAVGVFDNEARGVEKSLSMLEAFSAAPPELRKELDPSFNDRVLTPLVDRTVNLGKKLTPADHGERIRNRLEVAGNPPGWTVDRVTALKFIGFAGALVVSLIIATLFGFGIAPMLGFCVIAAVVGYMAPNMYLYQVGYNRTQLMQRAMPDALDLLTISVESGLGFDAALVARRPQHGRSPGGRIRPRSSGDADRSGPRCRAPCARRAHTRSGAQGVCVCHGAG